MRSEHSYTRDEADLEMRRYFTRYTRAGVAKAIKTASHRLDRRTAKRAAIRDQMDN